MVSACNKHESSLMQVVQTSRLQTNEVPFLLKNKLTETTFYTNRLNCATSCLKFPSQAYIFTKRNPERISFIISNLLSVCVAALARSLPDL